VTADGAKAMFGAALSVLATGMKVSVVYDDSSTSYCYGRYLRVRSSIDFGVILTPVSRIGTAGFEAYLTFSP
jgi:hypothetical protein